MAASVLWTILIFVGCSLPGKDLPPVSMFDHFDKVVHFVFFFVFALLWLGVFVEPKQAYRWQHVVWVLVTSLGYGLLLEYYQLFFVAGRSWDVWDAVADGIGGLLGGLFAKNWRNFAIRKGV